MGDFFGDRQARVIFLERICVGIREGGFFLAKRARRYFFKRNDMHKRIFETERTRGGSFLERTRGILEESKGLRTEIGLPL